jgi:predicted O-linked N-acetylglucosamine transferase (SPINDLY family)
VNSGPLSREQFGLPGDAFVFCCFNKNYKISRQIFEIWMRLLRSVEGSVLWLSANAGRATDAMQREAERHGVDPGRIVFAAGLNDRADHLARLRLGDLFLDTLPYNAHTTACDALFMGLPVVTSPGPTFVGRVAASMLHAVGLDELVTSNLSEYEALALTLALDRKKYGELRSKLEAHKKTYPLFQTDVFRSNLEKAYDTMHGIYRSGEKPRSFEVEN